MARRLCPEVVVAPTVVLAVLLSLGACATASRSTSVRSPRPSSTALGASTLATQYGLHLQGGALRVVHDTLPRRFRMGAWYYYQDASLKGGFDLRPWAGKSVTLTSYALSETHNGHPARLWTVRLGDRIIGAYIAVDGETPGIYGLREVASQW